MRHDGKINRFCARCLPLKWLLVSLLIPAFCFGQEVQIQPVKSWYICTSKPYQLTFGSSMQCPNIEQKVKHALLNYLRWAYKDLGGRKQAMEAYRSFVCKSEVR